MNSSTLLGGLSAAQFIENYWQKKPLLIKQAIPGYRCPISAEELAGLALEAEVESRLVQQQDDRWSCRYGPFAEAEFTSLPERDWTLLVQSCNRYVEEFAELLQRFDFLPAWRLDDIMVSYAADQGSVGPHLDQYDVFLLQGEGRREWRIAEGDFSQAPCLPDLDLQILSDFKAQQSWCLEPGDMLYLPPGVAHYGIAQGACITISVGFRAANASQMLNAFCDNLLAEQQQQLSQLFFRDNFAPTSLAPATGGEIDRNAQNQFRQLLRPWLEAQLDNPNWMALAVTQAGTPPDLPSEPIDNELLQSCLAAGATLWRDQGSRLAYVKNAEALTWYANGEAYAAASEQEVLLKLLSSRQFLHQDEIAAHLENDLLYQMLNLGLWYIADYEPTENE